MKVLEEAQSASEGSLAELYVLTVHLVPQLWVLNDAVSGYVDRTLDRGLFQRVPATSGH